MSEPNKRKILILLIVLTSAPSLLLLDVPTPVNAAKIALYLSGITGYLGVMLLLWMYVLGAKSVFGLWFRDIAPVMKIHRLLGTYGAIAILLHPLLIIYSYGESLLYPLVPHIGSVFERHVTLGRLAFLLFATVWLTSALLRKRMGYRPWKYIHYLAYICLPFALLHIPGVGSQYMSSTAVQLYFIAILLTFVIFSLLRLRGFINSDRTTYVITRHSLLSPGTYLLEMQPKEREAFIRPKTGQYVHIKLGLISEDHPFSVVAANKDGSLILAYRTVGRFTNFLSQQAPGTSIQVSQPSGAFLETMDASKPTVFIAGGIGITPFVQALISERSPENTWLISANRTKESSVFLDRISASLGANNIALYSDEGKREFLDRSVLEQHLNNPTAYQYFLCGPEGFMRAAKEILASLDVPKSHITTESFDFA